MAAEELGVFEGVGAVLAAGPDVVGGFGVDAGEYFHVVGGPDGAVGEVHGGCFYLGIGLIGPVCIIRVGRRKMETTLHHTAVGPCFRRGDEEGGARPFDKLWVSG